MIKFTYIYLRPVALFLSVIVLFQCCKAYDLRSTSIDKAVGPQIRYVKITTHDHKEFLFDSIYYKNDKLFGLLKKSTKKNLLEIELNVEDIKTVQIHVLNKEKSKSSTRTLLTATGIFIVCFGVLYLWAINMSF